MSCVIIVYFVGMALGPYVGGAFAGNGTWRWVFWINLPVGTYQFDDRQLSQYANPCLDWRYVHDYEPIIPQSQT